MPIADSCVDLEHAAARIVHDLGGRWRHGGAMCRCPAHEDRIPSLSIRVGRSTLLFKCFAGCDPADVIRGIRRRNLPIPAGARDGEKMIDRAPGFGAQARRIWNQSRSVEATPAAHYLATRGISARSPALRYHSSTPLGRGGAVRFRPALIAAVHQGAELVAIQRSFLCSNGEGLARDLAEPRLALGRPLSGAVKLARAGGVLGLAEGIESALSAIQLLGIPVWATLGGERLPQIAIPRQVRRLVLLPDADRSGRIAERKSRDFYASLDIEIETIWPWFGEKDWNDLISKEGEGDAGAVRVAV